MNKYSVSGCDEMPLIVIVFLLILIAGAALEGFVLINAYLHADKVKCNWIFCEFTQTRTESIVSQECFTNGIQVNC